MENAHRGKTRARARTQRVQHQREERELSEGKLAFHRRDERELKRQFETTDSKF